MHRFSDPLKERRSHPCGRKKIWSQTINHLNNCHFTLIRGLARESYHWDKFPTLLQATFPHAEVEFIDLPGNGEFHYLDSPIHLEDYIEFVRLNSHFIKSNKKINIIALSFGAMIAYHWSLKYTSEIASLILINTSFRPSPFYRRIRPSFFYRLFYILTSKNTYLREKEILKLTTHLLDQRIDAIAESWSTRTQLKGTSLLNALKQIYVASQTSRSRKSPTTKTLLLCSKQDDLVHFRCSQETANDWKIPLKIHSSAGHDLTLDDPQWVIEQIKQFFITC